MGKVNLPKKKQIYWILGLILVGFVFFSYQAHWFDNVKWPSADLTGTRNVMDITPSSGSFAKTPATSPGPIPTIKGFSWHEFIDRARIIVVLNSTAVGQWVSFPVLVTSYASTLNYPIVTVPLQDYAEGKIVAIIDLSVKQPYSGFSPDNELITLGFYLYENNYYMREPSKFNCYIVKEFQFQGNVYQTYFHSISGYNAIWNYYTEKTLDLVVPEFSNAIPFILLFAILPVVAYYKFHHRKAVQVANT